MTPEQSARILESVGFSPAMMHHLAIEQAITKTRLVAGNSTVVLHNGPPTFKSMFAAIKSARSYINLEYYIFEDVESDGALLSTLLLKKRRAGVAVNVIYDSYGSNATPPAFFDRLKKAGVRIVEFNPMNPLDAKAGYAPIDRDHRKILVVDGSLAIVGGVNLSTTYQPHSPGKSSGPPGLSAAFWRDTDLEIRGPAVADIEDIFVEHWLQQKGPSPEQKKLLSEEKGCGHGDRARHSEHPR